VSVTVELDAVQRVARAIGETNPVFFDEAAAHAEGYRSIPIPPTYVFCLKLAVAGPEAALRSLGVEGESGKLLHAEQSYEYLEPICAGDRISFRERVADVYEKKGGALVFVVFETLVSDADRRRLAVIRHTEVIRRDA
jgi:acyl dehydratase